MTRFFPPDRFPGLAGRKLPARPRQGFTPIEDDPVEPNRRTLAGATLKSASERHELAEATRTFARSCLANDVAPAEIRALCLDAIGPTSTRVVEIVGETLQEFLGPEGEGAPIDV